MGLLEKRNAPEPNQYIIQSADVYTNSYSYDYKLICLSGKTSELVFWINNLLQLFATISLFTNVIFFNVILMFY